MSLSATQQYVSTLTEAQQKRAQEELNEDPATRQRDIQAIRQWLKKQPHIHARPDDWSILRFLRGCKFSLERTKEKLDMFYTCKTAVPEWFTGRDPHNPKMRELLKMGVMVPLPNKLASGATVLLGRFGLYDPSKISIDDLNKMAITMWEVLLDLEEGTSIDGLVIISDLKGSTVSHFTSFTPTVAKKSSVFMQEGYPVRPKALHYINTPQGFETVFNIFKSFMKEKMKKRLHVHGSNMEALYESVPQSILPEEYGGTGGSIQEITDEWLKRVDARKDWLKDDEQYKVNEAKRPGKPKTSSDLFGLEGSFRQLNVD